MLSLSPIVAQLKAGRAGHAEGVLEFGAQERAPTQLPARFVVPLSEDAAPSRMAGVRDQLVQARFSVFVLVQAKRHRDSIAEDLKVETDAVIQRLVGWTHPEASGPFDYVGGRMASADGALIVWEVRVTAPYHLRKSS